MRILHVIPAVAPRYGGPSVVAVETVRALRREGHDAFVATTDADGPSRLDVPHGTVVEWQGVPIVAFPLGGGEGFKWSAALARWLREAVASVDVVDIHAIFSHSSIAAASAARRAGVPFVVRPHGALDPWSLGRKALRKRLLLRVAVRRMLEDAACVQYTTAAEMEAASRALPWLGRGRVVPIGISDQAFGTPERRATRPYVLTLSRLDAKKSLELLIDAFHDAGVEGWRLVIAGDGPGDYVDSLRSRAAAGPAARRIEFVGWVDGERKRQLLRGASLLASPSAQENFGLSVAEAMAVGVPVLVTPGVNLAPEIEVARAGWVVARELSTLTLTLRSICRDDDERERRGAAARALAERFRWSTCVKPLIDLYDAVRAGAPVHA